jgi:uncharacterized membrane protein YkvI
MNGNKSTLKMVLLTSASFAGYNIGSGFATGVEALQFFSSWGATHAFASIAIAAFYSIIVLSMIYITGFEQQFTDSKQIYLYFCGKKVGKIFDYYIYISMILITLTMMSGSGATIQQYSGLPTVVGATLMGIVCVIASLLGLEKLRNILSYMCILIIIFVLFCGIYATFTSNLNPVEATLKIQQYVASGTILRASAFGIRNPYLSGIASAGLVIGSGFAWASVTGTLCKTKKEAILSGVFSSIFYYLSTAVVVYLLLISIEHVAGKEVPMLAVIQYFLPGLSIFYSAIIIIAIFSTISGRLFSIGEHYSNGNKKTNSLIIVSIATLAIFGASFIPFSKISNIVFSLCGAVGIIFSMIIIIKFFLNRIENKNIPNKSFCVTSRIK